MVTCGTAQHRADAPLDGSAAPSAPAPPPPPVTSSVAPAIPSAIASVEPPAPIVPAGPLARDPGRELPNFFAALRALANKQRSEHVRVAWLGDSHGAADMWSGALREVLQKRFGNAGPGFVHLGYKAYRHEAIRIEIGGKWRMHPKGASSMTKIGDGVFGLGGMLFVGQEQSPRASLVVTDASLPNKLLVDVCMKPGAETDEITIKLTGERDTVVTGKGAVSKLVHTSLTAAGATPTLTVVPTAGSPEVCGAIFETDPKAQPGVVLDALGVNGARLGTPLAWDEATWIAELARRPPSLVILEYGTNESSDLVIKPEPYKDKLARVLARIRKASPACDCVVLAPTERADTMERSPLVRDVLREAAKASRCWFWDTYDVMGGKGGILTWRSDKPPRAGKDGVHLTAKGYRELGERLAKDMLALYDAR